MSKYKWDFKQIRNIRDALLLMYNESEEEKKDCILPLVDLYSSMLSLAKRKKDEFDVFDDRFQGLDTMELISEVSNSYITKNFEILDVLLKGYTTVNENFIEDDGIDPEMICDNDYLISITKDYFKKMTPKYIYDNFLNEINNNRSFLNISYSKENGDYGGVTIFDSIFNKKYVSVSRTNNLFDLVILPHEMFHYLFNDTDINAFGNYNTYYLTEVEGSFSNILFGEYFKENSTEYNLFFTKRYINNFQAQMDEIAIRNQLLDSIKNNKTVRLNKLNKFMYYHNINKFDKTEDINEYLEIPQEIDMKYALSYLTAIDLYYIYLKDRDFAFYLLKNIRYVKEENDIINLLRRNHITFMDDGYENYKSYTKKLKKDEEIYK